MQTNQKFFKELLGKPRFGPETVFVVRCRDADVCLMHLIATLAPWQITKRTVGVIGAATSAALSAVCKWCPVHRRVASRSGLFEREQCIERRFRG